MALLVEALKEIESISKKNKKRVNKVLNELDIIRVTKLYALDDDWICHCIRKHKYFKTLFSKSEEMLENSLLFRSEETENFIRTVTLWESVAAKYGQFQADYVSLLKRPYSSFLDHELPTMESLMRPMQNYIARKLVVLPIYPAICESLGDTSESDLGPLLSRQYELDPKDINGQERDWRRMTVWQADLNAKKSKQLYHFADLVEKYPHMLKKDGDPAFEARPNSQHIVNYLRRSAENVNKEWCFRSGHKVSSSPWWSEDLVHLPRLCSKALFKNQWLPIRPVLKYWEIFKILWRLHPPLIAENGLLQESMLASLRSLGERWGSVGMTERLKGIDLPQSPHVYPQSVLQDYVHFIRGIKFYRHGRAGRYYDEVAYSGEQKDEAKRSQRQRQRRGEDPDIYKDPAELGYQLGCKKIPWQCYAHDDAQIALLEAFLRVCSYLEATFLQDAEYRATIFKIADAAMKLTRDGDEETERSFCFDFTD
ncbi:hypothetical protein MMC26_003973 [Xylographa opegraphella]|nr:hypothetical protein [Xylographa opegraphella]